MITRTPPSTRTRVRQRRFAPALVLASALALVVAATLVRLPAPLAAQASGSSVAVAVTPTLVSGAQVWGPVDADRELTEDLVVPIGGHLTLEPGTTLRFAEGTGLVVAGELTAIGTPEAPITLSGIDAAAWTGLRTVGSGHLETAHLTLSNAPATAPRGSATTSVALTAAATGEAATGCTDVLFLGLMGSGEHEEIGNHDLLGAKVRGIYDGMRAGMAADPGLSELSIARVGIPYAANPVPFLGAPADSASAAIQSVQDFVPGAWDGATRLITALQSAHRECPTQRIVIGGYSQGAWAIHAALDYLDTADSDLIAAISAVALVADPLRSAAAALPSVTGGAAGNGIAATSLGAAALGYAQWAQDAVGGSDPLFANIAMNTLRYPEALRSRTLELCATKDAICDTAATLRGATGQTMLAQILAGTEVHNGYQPRETGTLGKQIAALLAR